MGTREGSDSGRWERFSTAAAVAAAALLVVPLLAGPVGADVLEATLGAEVRAAGLDVPEAQALLDRYANFTDPPDRATPDLPVLPVEALIDEVELFAEDLGFPDLSATTAVVGAGLPDEVAGRLAQTLEVMRTCQAETDAAVDTIDDLAAAANGTEEVDPAAFQGVRDCAGDLAWHVDLLEVAVENNLGEGGAIDLWPVLRFEVAVDDTTYIHDYALLVDQRGDDTYDNNGGGNLIDLNFGPEGSVAERNDEALGCQRAIPGLVNQDCSIAVGVLLDLRGDDTYGLFESPLVDAECTNDDVVRRMMGNGAGFAGVGILRDAQGDDTYNGKTVANGAGHVFGVGILSDGDGDDTHLSVRNSQGFGLVGGLGLLLDRGNGVDTYDRYMPSPIDPDAENEEPGAGGVIDDEDLCDTIPRLLQGAGNVGSLGILLDDGGDDTYIGATSSDFGAPGDIGQETRSQGFGTNEAFGILLDLGGLNDVYEGVANRTNDATVVEVEVQNLDGGGLTTVAADLFHDNE